MWSFIGSSWGFAPRMIGVMVTPLVIKDDQLGNVRWRSNFGFVVGDLLIPHWLSAVFGESTDSMSYFRKMPSLSQIQVSAPMCTLFFYCKPPWLSYNKLGNGSTIGISIVFLLITMFFHVTTVEPFTIHGWSSKRRFEPVQRPLSYRFGKSSTPMENLLTSL